MPQQPPLSSANPRTATPDVSVPIANRLLVAVELPDRRRRAAWVTGVRSRIVSRVSVAVLIPLARIRVGVVGRWAQAGRIIMRAFAVSLSGMICHLYYYFFRGLDGVYCWCHIPIGKLLCHEADTMAPLY